MTVEVVVEAKKYVSEVASRSLLKQLFKQKNNP
jgi:hypothetical protein